MLHHHDRVGAPRQRPAGRDGSSGSGQHRNLRNRSACDRFRVERKPDGTRLRGGGEISGAQREAVDIGAVERRHVDRRRDVFGKRQSQRIRKNTLFRLCRPGKQGRFEAGERILARQYRQELLLTGALPGGRWRGVHVGGLNSNGGTEWRQRAYRRHIPRCRPAPQARHRPAA